MDKTLYCDASVGKDGELHLDMKWWKTALLRFAGKRIIIRVQGWTAKRSLAANNYYWGVIVDSIADYTGYDKDEVHAILKERFAKETRFVVNEKTGEITEVDIPRSTRTMTKAEFAEFIDKCDDFCVSLGIILPTYDGDRYAYREDD